MGCPRLMVLTRASSLKRSRGKTTTDHRPDSAGVCVGTGANRQNTSRPSSLLIFLSPQTGHWASAMGCAVTKRFRFKTCGKRSTSEKVALFGTNWHCFGGGVVRRHERRCGASLAVVSSGAPTSSARPKPAAKPRPTTQCSTEIHGRPLRRRREARVEHSGGKIPTLRAIRGSNLQLATDSAHTTARPPKTSSRRHGLTGLGLTCDDTFSPRASLQLNPIACRELRVTTLSGR
jgi:hypothetical protein